VARYGQAFKDRIVARLLPPESAAIDVVAREVGVSVGTLERWRAQALAAPSELANGQRWTPTARLEAVITTAAMDEATRSAWCREQGLYPAELEAWKRDAIAGLGEPRAASEVEARQDRRRVKELERELQRKDKALAETAALLVLAKKLGWQKRLPARVAPKGCELAGGVDGQDIGAGTAGAGMCAATGAELVSGLRQVHAHPLRE
jgi:transposase-like protein